MGRVMVKIALLRSLKLELAQTRAFSMCMFIPAQNSRFFLGRGFDCQLQMEVVCVPLTAWTCWGAKWEKRKLCKKHIWALPSIAQEYLLHLILLGTKFLSCSQFLWVTKIFFDSNWFWAGPSFPDWSWRTYDYRFRGGHLDPIFILIGCWTLSLSSTNINNQNFPCRTFPSLMSLWSQKAIHRIPSASLTCTSLRTETRSIWFVENISAGRSFNQIKSFWVVKSLSEIFESLAQTHHFKLSWILEELEEIRIKQRFRDAEAPLETANDHHAMAAESTTVTTFNI